MAMLNTFFIGLVFLYAWMIIGVLAFADLHRDGKGDPICSNMFQCLVAYLFIAMRGNGISDLTTNPSIPRNLIDSLSTPDFFSLQLLWELTYQVTRRASDKSLTAFPLQWLFIYVLLAIITGIVIDAFGSLRDKKQQEDEDLNKFCFVCNLERFKIDQVSMASRDVFTQQLLQLGVGFVKHIKLEHNARWYLFFLMRIKHTPVTLLTAQERYVRDKVCFPPARCSSRSAAGLA
eukprot:535241-Hanusia_phi.AAC.2